MFFNQKATSWTNDNKTLEKDPGISSLQNSLCYNSWVQLPVRPAVCGWWYERNVQIERERQCMYKLKQTIQTVQKSLSQPLHLHQQGCYPNGHCWNYSTGNLVFSQVRATHLQISTRRIPATATKCWKWAALTQIKQQSAWTVPTNGRQGTSYICILMYSDTTKGNLVYTYDAWGTM